MNDKRKAYEDKIDVQLQEWSVQIGLLQARAGTVKGEAKAEYHKTIDVLKHRQNGAREKLQGLKTSGDEAWEDLKIGAEKVWGEVKTSVQEATSRFK